MKKEHEVVLSHMEINALHNGNKSVANRIMGLCVFVAIGAT
jgi:hypothetical protein